MEDTNGILTGKNSSTCRRRPAMGALIASTSHIIAAIMLVFVIPTSRKLIGPDTGRSMSEFYDLYCGSGHDLMDDAAIFAFAFLLLPGWLTLASTAIVIPRIPLSMEISYAAMIVISAAVFAAFGAFLVAGQRWYVKLGILLIYAALAFGLAAVFRGGLMMKCSL
jgi:hypothetical protein